MTFHSEEIKPQWLHMAATNRVTEIFSGYGKEIMS